MRGSFWRGVLVALLALSIFQDVLGLERYVEWCKEHWYTTSAWWWVPPFIALILWQTLVEQKEKA